MSKLKPFGAVILSLVGAAGYGLLMRLTFATQPVSGLWGTISIGFLFFVPLGLGALTVYLAPASSQKSLAYAVFMPWLSATLFAVLAALLSLEAWICVVMACPFLWFLASLGGFILHVSLSKKRRAESSTSGQTGMVGLLLIAPFLIAPLIIAPLEMALPVTDSIRTVHTAIEVEADPATVWQQITRVPPISEAEHRWSFFHLAGLPRPRYATLTQDGVGGIRRGQWEAGLAFTEEIVEWRLYESYRMAMAADTSHLAPSSLPLDEIGGQYFDVIEGRYRIESVGPHKVILHFSSKHRLTTRFNSYGGLWTDFFMRDVQRYILRIVKARAEAETK